MRNDKPSSLPVALAFLLAVLLVGTLAGCGNDAGSSDRGSSRSASPSASATTDSSGGTTGASRAPAPWADTEPADGKEFRGHGFSFRAPRGWTDETAKARQLNQLVDLAAAGAPDRSGFATNVNVVVSDSGVDEPTDEQLGQVSQQIRKRLASLVPRLTVNRTTELAGRPTLDHEGAANKSGVGYYIHQYVAFKDGNAYTITFSFSPTTKPGKRQQVINAVMASWAWR